MNNSSPLVPQGSLGEQKQSNRARVKVAVFVVLAIHGIGLLALLMQGCKPSKTPQDSALQDVYSNAPPIFEERSNIVAAATEPITPQYSENTNTVAVPPIDSGITPYTPPVTPVPPPIQPSGTTTSEPLGTGSQHTIAKGDTFDSISKKYGVSSRALQDANPGLEPTRLKIGQVVQVPPPTPKTATATPAATPADNGNTYVVQSGDTLIRIASKHGTTPKAIRAANNLRTDRIKVGQKLRIPAKSAAPASGGTTPQ